MVSLPSENIPRVAVAIEKLNFRTLLEIFLRSPSTKTTEFEMKNKCESCERSKTFTVVILFFLRGNNR